jgi:hypothetical protein
MKNEIDMIYSKMLNFKVNRVVVEMKEVKQSVSHRILGADYIASFCADLAVVLR